jgi:type IV fimbrial biogenesis protein FimT
MITATSVEPARNCRRHGGFSLLELMVTLGVLGVLTTIAYPSMRDFMRRNRVAAQSSNLQADLQYARGQAAATRSYVSICPLTTAGTTTCNTGASFDAGWLVYSAPTSTVIYDAADPKFVLLHVAPAPSGVSLRSSASAGAGVLTYNARGDLLPGDVTFNACAQSSAGGLGSSTTAVPGVLLTVAGSGRISSSKMDAGTACGI